MQIVGFLMTRLKYFAPHLVIKYLLTNMILSFENPKMYHENLFLSITNTIIPKYCKGKGGYLKKSFLSFNKYVNYTERIKFSNLKKRFLCFCFEHYYNVVKHIQLV